MIDELERQCREALARLQREYQERAQPYIDTLARIEAMRPPTPIVIPLDVLTGIINDVVPPVMMRSSPHVIQPIDPEKAKIKGVRESFADVCVAYSQAARDRLT